MLNPEQTNDHTPIGPMPRYHLKLDPEQTAAMIKIAFTHPNVHNNDIIKGVGDLQLPQDPYLSQALGSPTGNLICQD